MSYPTYCNRPEQGACMTVAVGGVCFFVYGQVFAWSYAKSGVMLLRGQKVLTVRVPESLQAALKEAAAKEGISLSSLIRSRLERDDSLLNRRLDAIETELREIKELLRSGGAAIVADLPEPADSPDWMQAMVSPFLADDDEGEGDADA